jgi:starvation-inducible DNA-binding protein
MSIAEAKLRRVAPLRTPTDLASDATRDIAAAFTVLLADMFALYTKTKNFHWHISGPHFRDYHLMLDDQAAQILGTTDAIAERVRKIGGTTLRSIGHIARLQRIPDNDADYVTPLDMLAELRDNNIQLTMELRATQSVSDHQIDVAEASNNKNSQYEAQRLT